MDTAVHAHGALDRFCRAAYLLHACRPFPRREVVEKQHHLYRLPLCIPRRARLCPRAAHRVALPIAWKGILVYAVVVLVNFFGMLLICLSGSFFQLLVLVALDIAGLYFVIRIMRQLKALQTAAQKLAAGDLTYTVDTEKMYPVLKEHGDNLNAVSVGMSRAVNERMKSERFKTELITNVSHDLKTPLTSIVSYVDLLKKEPIESESAQEYIDVLDRQSQKLKKLTADLVDASKASSGALPVHSEKLDLGELLRQSAGECGGHRAGAARAGGGNVCHGRRAAALARAG